MPCGQRLLNVVASGLLVVCFCCAVVGTAGSQYSNTVTTAGTETTTKVYLYASRTKTDGDSDTTYYKRDDFECKATFDRLIAAFVFGLLGIAASFCAAGLALLGFCCKFLRWPVLVLAIAAAASLIIAFAISASTFATDQCDAPSPRDQDYSIDWGLIILIIGAGFAILAACFSISFCM